MIFEVLGVLGALAVLIPFLLAQVNKIDSNTFTFDFLNFLGSLMLFINALHNELWTFVVINFVWGVFSLKDVLIYLLKRK